MVCRAPDIRAALVHVYEGPAAVKHRVSTHMGALCWGQDKLPAQGKSLQAARFHRLENKSSPQKLVAHPGLQGQDGLWCMVAGGRGDTTWAEAMGSSCW